MPLIINRAIAPGRLYILAGTFLLLLLTFSVKAQTPTTQDCLGAIAVCDYIYVEDSTAAGFGNYFEIPYGGNGCPDDHCMDGERNSRWYIFTVIESGNLRFQITPQEPTDDYDWAVFNLTTRECSEIMDNPDVMMWSCNAAGGAGFQGTTGISSSSGGTVDCNNGGLTNKWNADLPVYEGQTLVLVVSDWTQTPGGYTLDFTSSDAVIFDDEKPYIQTIYDQLIDECGTNELRFNFSENVKCTSVSHLDFEMEGPGGPYTLDSIYGENCSIGGKTENQFTLYFTPGIYQSGTYTLKVKNLSFISDACNNYAEPESYDFEVSLDSPEADAGEDQMISYGGSTTLEGDGSGGSGNFSFHWEPADLLVDPDVSDPATVALTMNTQFILEITDQSSACLGEDTMWVYVSGGPLGVVLDASSTEICNGEQVNLFAYPSGGSESYTYSWTSDPPGFTSDMQNPTDFPSQTTTYTLEISDGFTVLTEELTVTVHPVPEADAGPNQTIEIGTSTTLDGSGSGGTGTYTFHWEPASLLVQNDIPNPQTLPLTEPVLFTLIITDENGCESESDNVLINTEGSSLSALPLADPPAICAGEQVLVTANATGGGGEYTYAWTSDPPGFFSDQPSFTVVPEVSTRYDLLLTDQFGSEFSGHVNVTVNPLPVIDLIPDNITLIGQDTISVCVRDSVWLDAGNDTDPTGTIYFWDGSYENRYYRASTNGNWLDWQTHSVSVKNGATGCENSGTITILFDFNQCAISVPEVRQDLEQALVIQPNPNQGSFNLLVMEEVMDVDLNLIDVGGRIIYTEHFSGVINPGQAFRIQPGFIDRGLYFVRLTTPSGYVIKKMVVQ